MKRYLIVAGLFICGLSEFGCNKIVGGAKTGEAEEEDNDVETNVSYSNTTLSVTNYMKWVQSKESGLKKEKTMNELCFTVQYKPYEYIACMEERENSISDTLLKKKISEMEGIQYYDLKILLKDNEGELLKHNITASDQYDKRVKYFAFEMQHGIELVEGNDTLPCTLYHFERTYDIAPYCTILIGFKMDKNKLGQPKTLLVYDKTFGNGLLKFTFKENKFLNLPKLETL